jgi:hypothetical protein
MARQEKAISIWEKKVQERLKKILVRLEAGKLKQDIFALTGDLDRPQDVLAQYDDAISMVSDDVRATVTLRCRLQAIHVGSVGVERTVVGQQFEVSWVK